MPGMMLLCADIKRSRQESPSDFRRPRMALRYPLSGNGSRAAPLGARGFFFSSSKTSYVPSYLLRISASFPRSVISWITSFISRPMAEKVPVLPFFISHSPFPSLPDMNSCLLDEHLHVINRAGIWHQPTRTVRHHPDEKAAKQRSKPKIQLPKIFLKIQNIRQRRNRPQFPLQRSRVIIVRQHFFVVQNNRLPNMLEAYYTT